MKRRSAHRVLALGLLASPGAHAQLGGEFRPVNVGYEYHAPVDYARRSQLDFHVYRADIAAPITLREKKTYFFPSFNFQGMSVGDAGPDAKVDLDLRLITVGTMLIHRVSDKWMGIVRTNYGIASDLAAPVSGQDFYFTGNALALYAFKPQFSLGAGVSYDQRTGNIMPIPLAALYWEPVKNFAVRGVVPASLFVSYRPARPLTLQLTGAFEGQRYHVSSDGVAPQGRKGSLAYSIIRAGAGARVHFSKWLHFEAIAGALVMRRFELFVDDQSRGHGFLPVGPYVGTSLWVGTSGWKEP